VSGVLKSAVTKRVRGDRPSPVHAALAAVAAGVVVTALTYRVIRSQ
jgi:hypothetical protein